jgi:hypothetical protein
VKSSPSSFPADAPRPAPERSGTRRPVGGVIDDCSEADAEAATQLEGAIASNEDQHA